MLPIYRPRHFLKIGKILTLPTRLSSLRVKKRFYKDVSVVSSGDGRFELTLDHRKLKTPSGKVFSIQSEPLAFAVANEWTSQRGEIMLSQMHLTGLCNTSLENPTNTTKEALVDSILCFLDTDTILFFSEEPEGLKERQEECWSPIINWFNKRFDVHFQSCTGLSTSVTNLEDREKIRRYLLSFDFFGINGFTFGVDAVKSLILMAAVVERKVSVEEAVRLSRLELEYQTDTWGNVEWAHDLELHDTSARTSAAAIFVHLSGMQHLTKQKSA